MNKIPKSFTVGGRDIEVKFVEWCDNHNIGDVLVEQGLINISQTAGRCIPHSETSKLNTFYHELTHAILAAMGESELYENEKFVCSFSGFLTEAVRSFKYEEDGE